jgi:hypothetical protein
VALVELVEDDDADRAQRGVVVQHAGQQALGDEAQAGVGAGGGVEADVVTDALADALAEAVGDAHG